MKKPFKVGLVAVNYFGKYKSDGVAVHVYRLSQELSRLGCEVHVFTSGLKNQVRHKYFGDGKVIVHEIRSNVETHAKNPVVKKRLSYAFFEMAVIQEISKEHSVEKLDVIHTHNVGSGGAFISKHFNEIPWIHTFHSLERKRLDLLSSEERKYIDVAQWMETSVKYADEYVTVSEKLKEEVMDHYKILKEKIGVIPNAVCPKMFYPKDNLRKDKRIGYVGRFSLEKGIDKLPEIIEGVLDGSNDAIFEIIAPIGNIPPTMKKVEAQIDRLIQKYPERIIWHKKAVAREELNDFYNRCMVLIQPSKYESFGLTVLEAMACGCVPIVSDRGGLPEVVDNAGRYIALRSSLFVKEILKLLEDYRLRERYNRRAIERSKLFEWGDVGLKTLNSYKRVQGDVKAEAAKKKDPKVSIIIPVYNVGGYIEATVDSFLKEDFKDFEIIMIDDCSTDDSYKIMKKMGKKDSRIKVLRNAKNLGKNNTVNRALDLVRGEYVCLFDSDDLNQVGRIGKQVEFLNKNKHVDLVYGDIVKFYSGEKDETFRKAVKFHGVKEALMKMKEASKMDLSKVEDACRILHPTDYIPASSTMFRREIIDRGLRMDTELRNSEDYDFWFQIIGHGYTIKKMNIITYKYRLHENQKSSNRDKMTIAKNHIFSKLKRGEYFE